MKLVQNQVYRCGDLFIRIVELERLEVHYKSIKDLVTGDGPHQRVSKKEFCRLIKGVSPLSQQEIRELRGELPPPAAEQR